LPDSEANETREQKSFRSTFEEEARNYLKSASTWNGTNLELFWKQHQKDFPRLFILAQALLSLSPTSSLCEGAFSTAGFIVSKHACTINPKTVKKKLFIHDNYKYVKQI
jgi:hypothetical protein